MSILIQDIEGLRRRIQQNEVALEEMKWARKFGGDDSEHITLDPIEARLKAEILELQQLIGRITEASSRPTPPSSPTSVWQRLRAATKV